MLQFLLDQHLSTKDETWLSTARKYNRLTPTQQAIFNEGMERHVFYSDKIGTEYDSGVAREICDDCRFNRAVWKEDDETFQRNEFKASFYA